MNGFVGVYGLVDGINIYWVGKEVAIANGFINTGVVLVHHAAGTQRHMAHFAVTHLAFRKANGHTGGVNQGFGALLPNFVPGRGLGILDGVMFGFVGIAKAIENQKDKRFFYVGHGRLTLRYELPG